ncbi:MAG: GMP/IMP nucleotidase [Gammaproteobacteria bacterium]
MINWNTIDIVMLDMDGTLLDLHFDNHFWLEHLPKSFGEKHGLDIEAAKNTLISKYHAVRGTLDWYCIDYWEQMLDLNIMVLKEEIAHLIAFHPHVIEFLKWANAHQKRTILVTNAHQKSLKLKMKMTQLANNLDSVVCAHDVGLPKESPAFWSALNQIEPFYGENTLLIDDNLDVLRSARQAGIQHLLAVQHPDTKLAPINTEEFLAVRNFKDLIPVDD